MENPKGVADLCKNKPTCTKLIPLFLCVSGCKSKESTSSKKAKHNIIISKKTNREMESEEMEDRKQGMNEKRARLRGGE